jgi:DNA adenine methylase
MTAKPIVSWIGGKRKLAKHILPLFPDHECYVEPFCGAAALFFMKPPTKSEIINDVNGDIVNLYRVVKYHLGEFLKQFDWTITSRETYEGLKHTPMENLTDIQRAARFYYLQRLTFGGAVTNPRFSPRNQRRSPLDPFSIEKDLNAAKSRLARTYIERLDWTKCVSRYDREHTLFYCDPPYFGTEGYGVDFGLEQYAKLAETAKAIKGKMIISVNDIPEMREAFNGFNMKQITTFYNFNGAKETKPSSELLICNF